MKKNKTALLLTGIMLTAALASGCGKKEEEVTTTETVVNVEPVSTMTDSESIDLRHKEGYVISELTGEWIDESLEKQRPLCIMINNIGDAMPQSGISQADITYEMLVEGGITRFLCVFKDYSNLEKLGPVRSARHYYVQMADMHDGYYAHVGWSSYAEEAINNLGVDNLNGLTNLSTIMYYRDESRYAPHNVYTNTEMTMAGIAEDGYRTEHDDSYEEMFAFNYEDTAIGNGQAANKVSTYFNSYSDSWFEYNSEDKRYYRYQYGDKQIDDQTGEQLSYKNVIVMFVQYTDIWEGLLEIDWNKGGTGYYATDGEYKAITWRNENGVVKYFDENGNQLKMNPGNTFVTVFDETAAEQVTFE